MAEVLPGFTPPSASVNPDATVTALAPSGFPAMVIARDGRWTYELVLTDGALECGRWYVLGRGRTERKARRELARYEARQERETWTIT
jgi:hypothetical protein